MEAFQDIRHSALRAALGTLGVVACHAFVAALLGNVLFKINQAFPGVYEDFDAELPSATILAMNLGGFLFALRYWLLLLVVLDAIVYFLLARLQPRWHWLASVWALGGIVGMVAFFGFLSISLILPYQRLVEALR